MEGGEVLVKDIICVSLFNGMGCSFQAIDRVPGLRCVQKISSEIDKYANIVNDANYPETIQLGSVTDIEILKEDGVAVGLKGGNGVEVMFEKGVDILFVGGSPCQSFSFSGKRNGMSTKDNVEVLTLEHYLELKSEKYEFDGQSYLFWEFIRLREEIKPKYYLLENVEMGEKWEKVLSKAVGVNGIHINSALVSAQSRKRIYWINFGMKPMGLFGDMQSIVEQPKDRGILLKDILEEEVDEKYFLSEKAISYLQRAKDERVENVKYNDGSEKTSTLTANYKRGVHNGGETYVVEFKDRKVIQLSNNNKSNGGTQPYQQDRIYDVDGISPALSAHKADLIISLKSKDKRLKKMIENSDLVDGEVVHLDTYNQTLDREKTPTLRTGGKNDSFVYAPTLSKEEYKFRQDTPIPEDKDKFGSLRANAGGKTRGVGLELLSSRIRRLTVKECMRLQTVADDYKMPVSDSQAYRQLGNGWNIETIVHLFNYITLEK
jgi:DNA (cytosine-5)-methyltransferase 3A